jgi:hypothetical protein
MLVPRRHEAADLGVYCFAAEECDFTEGIDLERFPSVETCPGEPMVCVSRSLVETGLQGKGKDVTSRSFRWVPRARRHGYSRITS